MRIRSAASFVVCTFLALTAAADKSPPKLRLDETARPTRYAARITVDPSQATFRGAIDIELTIARASDTLWLNGTELTVDKASFTVNGSTISARVVPGGEDFIG